MTVCPDESPGLFFGLKTGTKTGPNIGPKNGPSYTVLGTLFTTVGPFLIQ